MLIFSTKLRTFSTDPSSKLYVLGHDGDTLGVNGAQVGIFEESNEISLASLLKSQHSRALETEISLEVLGNFSNETLERHLADEKISSLLVLSYIAESNSAL